MEKAIKVSVITISFNSVRTIERAIMSVIDQDYPNIEYIIVDGGSSDGTVDIINRYNNYISKWVTEKDGGISDAFNKGIAMSTGDVIGIINSDDGLLPGAIKKLVDSYDEKTDVYRGNILFWNEDTGSRVREIPSMRLNYSGMGLRFCHQGTFVTKEAYSKFGLFNRCYKYNMDYDLLLRFQNAGASFKYVDYDMAYFTMGGITFSKYSRNQRIEMENIIKSNGGTWINIIQFRVVKYCKMFIKKFVNIDLILRIKNRKANVEGIKDESSAN